jgi:hypothetical protein
MDGFAYRHLDLPHDGGSSSSRVEFGGGITSKCEGVTAGEHGPQLNHIEYDAFLERFQPAVRFPRICDKRVIGGGSEVVCGPCERTNITEGKKQRGR